MRDCLQHKPSRPGRRVQLSDSEVLTLMLCSQWFGTSQRGFMLAPASTEARWVAESFLCWRNNPLSRPYEPSDLPSPIRHNGKRYVGTTGPIWPRSAVGRAVSEPYLADNGFFGAFWQKHWSERYGAKALTPKNYVGSDSAAAKRQHSSRKQVVETINSHLENVFGLHFPLARTKWGLLSRVAAKVAALGDLVEPLLRSS